MSLSAVEVKRKTVHVGCGLFALAFARLSWHEAALAALAALAFNLFVLPRAGGGNLLREADIDRGFPVGILVYPVTVLALVLLFPHDLALAAAGWAYLAFGDGSATLVGSSLGGPSLFWNRGKSWSGFVAYVVLGGGAAVALYGFVAGRMASAFEIVALAAGALVGAIFESLPSELDDNLVAPLAGAAVAASLIPALPALSTIATPEWLRRAGEGALLNLGVAVVLGFLRVVRPSGAVAGFVLGSVVYAFGGREGYLLLWIFFGVGTAATRFGKKRKEAMGKAEEAGGRRGAVHVLANVSVAAFALFVAAGAPEPRAGLFRLAAAAAFATALMDTVGTEVGQAVRTPTVLLPDLTRVPPGTDGAVSIAGTLAGLFAAGFVAAAALDLHVVTTTGALLVVAAAFLGTVAESLLGRAGAPWRVTNGHVLNLYNTAVGAVSAYGLAHLVSAP